MKPVQILPRSPDAFNKWSEEHRTLIWDMIERLGKGEVTCKEAREVLREEKKALSAASKRVFGFKTVPGPQSNPAQAASGVTKARKVKSAPRHRTSAPPRM